jgi:hypothetical protein
VRLVLRVAEVQGRAAKVEAEAGVAVVAREIEVQPNAVVAGTLPRQERLQAVYVVEVPHTVARKRWDF